MSDYTLRTTQEGTTTLALTSDHVSDGDVELLSAWLATKTATTVDLEPPVVICDGRLGEEVGYAKFDDAVVEVEFTEEDGKLGIVFGDRWPYVQKIQDGTPGARIAELVADCKLLTINGAPVDGIPLKQAVPLVQERPLKLVFAKQREREPAEPARVSMADFMAWLALSEEQREELPKFIHNVSEL